jgi:hypothetical protein
MNTKQSRQKGTVAFIPRGMTAGKLPGATFAHIILFL